MWLGLDTSTLTASLALMRQGPGGAWSVVATRSEGPPAKQSELLPGSISGLLAAQGLGVEALSGIVVGLGPGSFTGLRIGVAAAKGLAYALEIPVCGVSSLAAAAACGPEGVPLYVTAVARVDDLYLGRFVREGAQVRALGAEEALSPQELAARLAADPSAVVMGPAVAGYGAKLADLGVAASRILDAGAVPPAEALVRLASLPGAFDPQSLFALEPHYVRSSGAEMNPKFPPLPGPEPVARLKED
ncbi:MAG: hypothetical protein RL653_1922 [Pseudomonadota bacterium]|jgi:tRNA threonylcarbamoyladenosine biosynthesis protein TsaB